MWEDKQNQNGGRYLLKVKKQFANRFWEDLLLGVVGETYPQSESLSGVVIHSRKYFILLSVWVKEHTCQQQDHQLRKWICETLKIQDAQSIEYTDHPKQAD